MRARSIGLFAAVALANALGAAPLAAESPEHPESAEAAAPAAAAAAPGGARAVGPAAPAGSTTERFDAANAAFAAGRYEEAIAGFRSIADSEGYSSALLFDLANAYLRAGHLGEAILWYERARLLAPRDADIAANLRQARRAANLPLPAEDDAWTRLEERASPDGWAILASALLFLAAGMAVAARLGRGRSIGPARARARLLRLGAACALVLSAGAAGLALGRLRSFDRAVIVGPDPDLRVAPYAAATVASALDPGEIVRVERDHQGYRLVRTGDGRSGWVAAGSAEPILPR